MSAARGQPRALAFFVQDGQDVGLAQDEQVLIEQLELGAAVLGEEDAVADLDLHRRARATLEQLASADRDHLALLGLLLGGIGNHNARARHFLFARWLHDHTIADRLNLVCHVCVPPQEPVLMVASRRPARECGEPEAVPRGPCKMQDAESTRVSIAQVSLDGGWSSLARMLRDKLGSHLASTTDGRCSDADAP